MDLVTVTCERDLEQMLLQAESIQKYLDPCTHWVIINDQTNSKWLWSRRLKKYYTKHRLNILTPNYIKMIGDDWDKQQAYKLLISKYVTDDYVVLDSKNFFIKPTNINEWRNILGSGVKQKIVNCETWGSTSKLYSEKLNKESIPFCLSLQTPFVIKLDYIKKLGNIEDFIQWFDQTSQKIMHSEFLLYSYLVDEYIWKHKKNNNHITLWPSDPELSRDYLSNIDRSDVKVFGFHRLYLEKIRDNPNDCIGVINDWLNSHGFKNRISKRPIVVKKRKSIYEYFRYKIKNEFFTSKNFL